MAFGNQQLAIGQIRIKIKVQFKIFLPHLTSVVYCGEHGESPVEMNFKKEDDKKKAQSAAIRASISFPPEIYDTLETIAKQKKVSLAWVVREAAEQYIAEKWPLLARPV
jgi:Ribbon-helix-helix protein, copG family